jgi:hypothetical protein
MIQLMGMQGKELESLNRFAMHNPWCNIDAVIEKK